MHSESRRRLRRRCERPARERGAALIVALIFLMLMTLIGTTAMRGATMQEQMAGNTRDWNLAFQAAEAALREAEDFLLVTPVMPEFDDAAGLYQVNSPDVPVWTGAVTSAGNGFIAYGGNLTGIVDLPRYYIEELSTVRPPGTETETGTPLDEVFYFRVTAVGFGAAVDGIGDPVASVVLSTVYRSR
jgi:type IV pilus assembly protein PilX